MVPLIALSGVYVVRVRVRVDNPCREPDLGWSFFDERRGCSFKPSTKGKQTSGNAT
jgi:hypothetical protein